MDVVKSIQKQKSISDYKKVLENEFKKLNVSDLILHEYPKFSIYFKDGSSWHSFDFDCFTQSALYKYLKNYI